MRAAAAGVGAANLTALLLTHLHSDHITDLSDVITTRWVTTFVRTPLPIIGPPGTKAVVGRDAGALASTSSYRIAHHADITGPPAVDVHEYTDGPVWDADAGASGGTPITARSNRPSRSGWSIRGPRWCWRATRCPARRSTSWPPARMRWFTRHPEGPRRAGPPAAPQGHPRLPLVGAAGGRHGGASRCRHPGVSPITCRRCCRARRISGGRWRPPSSQAYRTRRRSAPGRVQ
jgi:hypothetical protein